MSGEQDADWDYVIVGSGAGGGTLAARLAKAGMRVFLLEAGSDPRAVDAQRLPEDYDVPGFHAYASENAEMNWHFYARHYASEERQSRDWKYQPGRGVLYPRAATLGGCTAHNAMIFVLPHDSDWNHIAELTGDDSWRASRMRHYIKKVENCRHRPLRRALRHIGIDGSGHGWNGWLQTEKAVPHEALADDELLDTVADTTLRFVSSLPAALLKVGRWLWNHGDPNARTWLRRSFEGVCYTPMSTRGHRRIGTRERLLQAAADHPGKLHIEMEALATRVILDAQGNAVGVEYLKGRHLYRAHSRPSTQAGEVRQVRARREVILCGGAFNTPQLLMLSGIGPAEELRAHGIETRVDLPGVGHNLQDRYEVALTHRMRRPWKVLKGARFERGDPLWHLWNEARSGAYMTNGATLAIARRSSPEKAEPDLFCMAMLARFEGYFDGFSKLIAAHDDYLSWVVLKAHTRNCAGTVTLRSADPLDPPLINFRYFDEGNDSESDDIDAVVAGMKFVREMTAPLLDKGLITEELSPGRGIGSDAELADYARATAWGHHASCTCAIGPRERGGVVDTRFRVHGVGRLRVVDASVFPRIPGFFIVSAVYMIAEKAADVILDDAANATDMAAGFGSA